MQMVHVNIVDILTASASPQPQIMRSGFLAVVADRKLYETRLVVSWEQREEDVSTLCAAPKPLS
jgi:hypothetical protein